MGRAYRLAKPVTAETDGAWSARMPGTDIVVTAPSEKAAVRAATEALVELLGRMTDSERAAYIDEYGTDLGYVEPGTCVVDRFEGPTPWSLTPATGGQAHPRRAGDPEVRGVNDPVEDYPPY